MTVGNTVCLGFADQLLARLQLPLRTGNGPRCFGMRPPVGYTLCIKLRQRLLVFQQLLFNFEWIGSHAVRCSTPLIRGNGSSGMLHGVQGVLRYQGIAASFEQLLGLLLANLQTAFRSPRLLFDSRQVLFNLIKHIMRVSQDLARFILQIGGVQHITLLEFGLHLVE